MLMDGSRLSLKPELWGGIECTINRIGNRYRDQLLLSGHYERPGDISQFTSLGIKAIRYPVLWERHEQHGGQQTDWSSTQGRLEQLRNSGVTIIAGLVHHGSGPRYTDLLDPNFPRYLERYATAVAKKFPWLENYTPINEPLTTARFSGLYGFWYPHHKNDADFVRMFMNQMKGIVVAMKAIRKINPAARLIQTEDLGKTHSTPLLRYQADFENQRRWLTYDLLCGQVTPHHAMWEYLTCNGIDEASLHFFTEHPCPPDIAGMNYYVTSERFLDERVELYSPASAGGNGRHIYADVEAVRVAPYDGLGGLLREAWQRYRLPMAVTEVHLNCTREEQMRWLQESWNTCCRIRAENIDIRAVTAWSLLGSFDWSSLLTREDMHYESGVFDVSNNTARPTALAAQIASLATLGNYQHPLLEQKGWWHTANTTLIYSNAGLTRPLVIRGSTDLEGALQQQCAQRNIPYVVVNNFKREKLSEDDIKSIIDTYGAWGIIDISEEPYVDPDDTGASVLARLSVYHNIPCMVLSGDQFLSEKHPHFVRMSIDLLIDRVSGVWRITETGAFPEEHFRSFEIEAAHGQYSRKGAVNS